MATCIMRLDAYTDNGYSGWVDKYSNTSYKVFFEGHNMNVGSGISFSNYVFALEYLIREYNRLNLSMNLRSD